MFYLRTICFLVFFMIGSNSMFAQDPASWFKRWKDPTNNDSVRLSCLELLTFDLAYSNPDSALKLVEIEKKEAKQYKRPLYYACAFYNAAVAFKSKGKSLEGIENARNAIKEFEIIKDTSKVANSYNLLGSLFDMQGDIDRCAEAYLKSIKIKEELGDKRGMANSYNNLGNVMKQASVYDKAIEYYNKSIELRKEKKDDMGLAKGLNNLGSLLIEKGEYEKALSLFRQSIELRKKSGNEKSVINVMGNLGSVFLKMNMKDSALYYFKSYAELAKKQADVSNEAAALINLAHVLGLNGKYKEAEELLKEAAAKTDGKNLLMIEKDLYKGMYEVYNALKKYDLALQYHLKYVTLRDSVFSDERKSSVIQHQMRFEFEKKEAEAKTEQARKDGETAAHIQEQKKTIFISLSAGILVLLLLVVAVIAYRNSRRANKKIEKQNEVILHQKHQVEEKQKEILDSINYARRIQYTLLAHDQFLKDHIAEHFIYFHPKDIVSGDFYWAAKKGSRFYLAVCDSTGHGVPGAFMSLLNIGFLSEAILEKNIEQPNEVFDFVRKKLVSTISKEGQKDGFDGILVCFESNRITYAAANNNPVLISNGTLKELDADRMPVGIGEKNEPFKLFEVNAAKGDTLYLYTDGYADQFGGPRGKKFKYKQLNELLDSLQNMSTEKQQEELRNAFIKWKGELEQIDDVCVMGIKL